jgi:hypothetical protein
MGIYTARQHKQLRSGNSCCHDRSSTSKDALSSSMPMARSEFISPMHYLESAARCAAPSSARCGSPGYVLLSVMPVSKSNQSRWEPFSEEELESIREALQDAEDGGQIGSIGASLIPEIQNEIDSR